MSIESREVCGDLCDELGIDSNVLPPNESEMAFCLEETVLILLSMTLC